MKSRSEEKGDKRESKEVWGKWAKTKDRVEERKTGREGKKERRRGRDREGEEDEEMEGERNEDDEEEEEKKKKEMKPSGRFGCVMTGWDNGAGTNESRILHGTRQKKMQV